MVEQNEVMRLSAGARGEVSKIAEPASHIVPRPPFTLAEFVTIAREVLQQSGRNRRVITRFNVYVDIDGIFRQRRSEPDPTSAEEFLAIVEQTGRYGDRRWANQIRELWMDYASACRALEEFWRRR